ncbi:hypothetical protein N9937_00280 [bacterium]|nr:hypothetical protein [bacterium]
MKTEMTMQTRYDIYIAYTQGINSGNKTKVGAEFNTSARTVGRVVALISAMDDEELEGHGVVLTSEEGHTSPEEGQVAPVKRPVSEFKVGDKVRIAPDFRTMETPAGCARGCWLIGEVDDGVLNPEETYTVNDICTDNAVRLHGSPFWFSYAQFVMAPAEAESPCKDCEGCDCGEKPEPAVGFEVGDRVRQKLKGTFDPLYDPEDAGWMEEHRYLHGEEGVVISIGERETDCTCAPFIQFDCGEEWYCDSSWLENADSAVEVVEVVEAVEAPQYIVTPLSVIVVVDGTPISMDSTNPTYKGVVDAITTEDWERVNVLMDTPKAIEEYTQGKITVKDGEVFYQGFLVNNTLTRYILDGLSTGKIQENVFNFLENLMANPSKDAVNELWEFLDKTSLPITEDGHFLAYKKVREDYTDGYTGKIDNSVGCTPSMPRSMVDSNRKNDCSIGFHFCSEDYLTNTIGGSKLMVVKINPADVVSIPESNVAKGRCWTYEVIEEIDRESGRISHFDK